MSLKTEIFCHKGHKACQFVEDGVIKQCSQYMMIPFNNPQTGETIDKWDCADKWQVILTLENTGAQRSTASAIESFRNEMKNDNQTLGKVLLMSQTRGKLNATK